MSVVVPLYNEAAGLEAFHGTLLHSVETAAKDSYEILYCNDGSDDDTNTLVTTWHQHNPRIKLLQLSRNFGKENALSAGIATACGQAVLMIDGDGQHPPELIPEFVAAWKDGSRVVVGLRSADSPEGWFKRTSSIWFYRLFNKLSGQKLVPGSTDFRLIDRSVQEAFSQLGEAERLTRGLIDWLGFKPAYIEFTSLPRWAGKATYKRARLLNLAANSFVSFSPKPLYIFGYLGMFITIAAFLLGSTVFVEQLLLGDPLSWKFTGTAMLAIMILFLVGLVLLSQGIMSLYVSHIHNQSKGRPLYVIDYDHSAGVKPNED